MSTGQTHTPSNAGNGQFATTQWSVVLAAGDLQREDAQAALTRLCETYWYPLYAYARRRGGSVHDAQDLTQAFLARVLEKGTLASASPERGRFRSFLLTSFRNFVTNEWDKATAEKRGGNQAALSLDFGWSESQYSIEPPVHVSPEKQFDRQWAITLLDRVLNKLKTECAQSGKSDQFDELKTFIIGSQDSSYADAAGKLGMSEGAVRTAVHRLRRRYRDILRGEIADTLDNPNDVEDEINSLFSALAE